MQASTQVETPGFDLTSRHSSSEDSYAAEWFGHIVPHAGVFSELAMSIRQQSALLALQATPHKEVIYTAYTHDLELLRRYQRECEACVQAAVHCSIMASSGSPRQAQKLQEETWELLKKQIPRE